MKLSAKEFLRDLVPLIKENLNEVKSEPIDDYNNGKIFAYYDILSLIQMQAEAFGISTKDLQLDYILENELTFSK